MPMSASGNRPSAYAANIRTLGLFKLRNAGTASSTGMRRPQGMPFAAQQAIRYSTEYS